MSQPDQYYSITYRKLLSRFKKIIPPIHPVVCRRKKFPKKEMCVGECWLEGKKFHIRIEHGLGNDAAIDTLIHEWAHILLWTPDNSIEFDDHGPEWGVTFARVYRIFEEQLVLNRDDDDPEKQALIARTKSEAQD